MLLFVLAVGKGGSAIGGDLSPGCDDAAIDDCNSNGIADDCEFVPPRLGVQPNGLTLSELPQQLISADVNADGLVDLVTANRDRQGPVSLSVFVNEGPTFAPEALYFAGDDLDPGDASVSAADLDGDGDVDLAVTAGSLIVLFGNAGHGTFERTGEVAQPESVSWVTLADVSNDGRPDIVTGFEAARAIAWYRNRGDGAFDAPLEFTVDGRPQVLRAGDLDGDGDLDLLVGRGLLRLTVEVLENQGDGSFVATRELTKGRISAIEPRDLDGDGLTDVVLTTETGVMVWLQNSGTGLGEPIELDGPARALAIGDFNGDDAIDLVVGDLDGKLVTAWVHRERGRYLPTQPFSLVHEQFVPLDSDGDRDVDIAVLGSSLRGITLLANGDADALTLLEASFAAGGRPHGLATGDFNGDGHLDVVSVHCGDGNYSVFAGTGDGRLETARSPEVEVDQNTPACAVASGDMDGDGDVDLILRGFLSRVRSAGYVALARNDGEGVLSPPEFFDSGSLTRLSVVTGDIDGDGDIDVATPAPGQGDVSVHFNDGSGDLTDRQDLRVAGGPIQVTLGDLNGDGLVDIVSANGASGVSLLFQESPASFLPVVVVPVPESPGSVTVGDFDRDGHVDVASSNAESSVAVVMNQGGGDFSGEIRFFPLPDIPNTLITADLNGDGLPDLVTTNEQASTLSILRGLGGGFFGTAETVAVRRGPRLSVSADIDADGDTDILVANRVDRSVSVLLNAAPNTEASADFLTSVCTELDYQSISVAGPPGGTIDRATKFVAPARPDANLLELVFQNVLRFSLHPEFLREVFPERFGALDGSQYRDLALRRATREYYAGSILRLRSEAGIAYGFDVAVDASDANEVLTQDEARSVYETLRTGFLLDPLGYAPQTPAAREAASGWEAPGFPVFLESEPEPEPEPIPEGELPTPVFEVEIPEDTIVCGLFEEARSPRAEYENKTQLVLRTGTLSLPTEEPMFTAELFEEVRFGPERQLATPVAAGVFSVRRSTRPGGVADFRFSYRQDFTLEGGELLELELVSPFRFSSVGEEPVESRLVLDEEFFTPDAGLEPFQSRVDGVVRARYGSCTHATLPSFEVSAELEDGTSLRFVERFDEEVVQFRTAAASLTRAEVTVPGAAPRVVDAYWDLVYSAFRHNTEITYWLILDPPLQIPDAELPDADLPGAEGAVHAIELAAPEAEVRPVAQASYLGADFEPFKTLGVRSFARSGGSSPAFRRGDVDGGAEVNIADAALLLDYLFRDATAPECIKTADWNDSGTINLVDVVAILSFVFRDGVPAREPFMECGADPTADGLSCEAYPPCR